MSSAPDLQSNVPQKAARKAKKPTAAQLAGSLVISIGEARKLLGVEVKGLTDDEIILLIYELTELAQLLLRYK